MTTSNARTSGFSSTRPTMLRWAIGVLSAIAIAVAANLVIAAVAVAAGANPEFNSLTPGPVIGFTVLGVLIGLIGWAVIRRFVPRPALVLGILVPTVTVLSFIPDLQFFSAPTAGVTAAVALMLMHVVVVAVAVPVYQRLLPVTRRRPNAAQDR